MHRAHAPSRYPEEDGQSGGDSGTDEAQAPGMARGAPEGKAGTRETREGDARYGTGGAIRWGTRHEAGSAKHGSEPNADGS